MTTPAPNEPPRFAFIRVLCPNLTETELRQADDNFQAYVELVLSVGARLESTDEADEPTPHHVRYPVS